MDRASWIHGFVTSQRSEDYSYRMGNEAEREERNWQFVSMAGRIYDATFATEEQIEVPEPRVHWFDGALSWLKQRMA